MIDHDKAPSVKDDAAGILIMLIPIAWFGWDVIHTSSTVGRFHSGFYVLFVLVFEVLILCRIFKTLWQRLHARCFSRPSEATPSESVRPESDE